VGRQNTKIYPIILFTVQFSWERKIHFKPPIWFFYRCFLIYIVALLLLKSLPLQLATVWSAFVTRILLSTNKITNTLCPIIFSIIFKFNFILKILSKTEFIASFARFLFLICKNLIYLQLKCVKLYCKYNVRAHSCQLYKKWYHKSNLSFYTNSHKHKNITYEAKQKYCSWNFS
jgi:hypothetical protein